MSGWRIGLGGQGRCERRIEVIEENAKKKSGGGGRFGRGGGSRGGGWEGGGGWLVAMLGVGGRG